MPQKIKNLSSILYPEFTEFRKQAESFNLIPVFKEILADTETPVSAFYKLTNGVKNKYCYLLESVEQGERLGRYSFICADPQLFFQSDTNDEFSNTTPMEQMYLNLKQYKPAENKLLPRFWGGAVGFVSYDYVHRLENLPIENKDGILWPETMFLLSRNILIFDHFRQKIKVVCSVFIDKKTGLEKQYLKAVNEIDNVVKTLRNSKPLTGNISSLNKNNNISSWSHSFPKNGFLSAVKKTKEYIRAGDIIQSVISQRFYKPISCSPFSIYRVLRTVNPSPYMFFLKFNDLHLVGSSPEILVRKENNIAEVRPIAGTRPRGTNDEQDKKYEHNLLRSVKERAEHLMLVDLGRNDLGRVCRYGTITVPEFMTIERYSHVMHIVSLVRGKLDKKHNVAQLFNVCFPAGTVSGAPKIRAMQIVDELEPTIRGPYAGAVGYISFQGNMDMAITIRTMIIKKDIVYVQSGAGIVSDSIPEKEYVETQSKAAALLKSVGIAENGME